MRYSDFSVTDFTLDEYFQSWVFGTGDDSVWNFWEAWLASHPEKLADVTEAKRILEAIRFEKHTLSADEVAGLWSRIHHVERKVVTDKRFPADRVSFFYKLAASMLLVGLVGMFYLVSGDRPWKEYRTSFGETKEFVLPDGSTVVLNANSKLSLVSEWNDDLPREILLDGEAFFSVVHTSNHQLFKVSTREGVTVEVLGTTFNVYDRTNGTKVVLNSGKIRLNLPTSSSPEMIMMKPGEMVEYKQKHYEKKTVDPELYIAWTDNKIILDRTSLAEMINMLKDSYGLEVKVLDSVLLTQTVSGSMPLGDPEILLEQMAKAFQLQIIRGGNVILMKEIVR